MLNRTLSKIRTLGNLFRLTSIISLHSIFRLKKSKRYQSGQVKTKLGLIEYVDATSLLAGLNEIFVDEIYKITTLSDGPLVVIDCGANIGLSAMYFANYNHAKVHAYEADPSIAQILQKNVLNNCRDGRVVVNNTAVWINNEGVIFDVEGAYSGQIQKHGHNLVKESVKVPSVRLRNLIANIEGANFLKLDIEGAENEALLDCEGVLKKLDYLFIEYHSIEHDSQYLGEILNLLKKEGFRYHLQEASVSRQPFVQVSVTCGMDLQLNIFATKNSRS